jgi:hypothetical protein
MQRCSLAVLCALASLPLLLTGCGGVPAGNSATSTVAPPQQIPTVTNLPIDGRWSFAPGILSASVSSTSQTGVTLEPANLGFHGTLTTKGDAVTGVGVMTADARTPSAALNLACIGLQPVTLHGTLSAARHLNLSSDPVNGGVLTLDADVPSDPHAAIPTTATLTGPCAATATLNGSLYEPLNGTYQGPLLQADLSARAYINQGVALATLTETTPDSTGKSVLSGSLTITLATCSAQFAISETRYGGGLYNVASQIPTTFVPLVAVTGVPDGISASARTTGLGLDCKGESNPASQTLLSALMTRQ